MRFAFGKPRFFIEILRSKAPLRTNFNLYYDVVLLAKTTFSSKPENAFGSSFLRSSAPFLFHGSFEIVQAYLPVYFVYFIKTRRTKLSRVLFRFFIKKLRNGNHCRAKQNSHPTGQDYVKKVPTVNPSD